MGINKEAQSGSRLAGQPLSYYNTEWHFCPMVKGKESQWSLAGGTAASSFLCPALALPSLLSEGSGVHSESRILSSLLWHESSALCHSVFYLQRCYGERAREVFGRGREIPETPCPLFQQWVEASLDKGNSSHPLGALSE